MAEIMTKVLSRSDATNRRLEFPMRNLGAFPLPGGQNSFEFIAFDGNDRPYKLKISIRNQGPYKKPWMSGDWRNYASEKKLKEGDRVKLSMHEQENGERRYRITAETKIFGFWVPISEV